MKDFPEWLVDELNKRQWSNNELARRAKLSNTVVSKVISNSQGAGVQFCRKVAHALGMPEEVVLRAAGLLSPKPETYFGEEEEILFTYRALEPAKRYEAKALLKTLLQLQEERAQYNAKK